MNRSDPIEYSSVFVHSSYKAVCDNNIVPFLRTRATQHRRALGVVIPIDISHPAPAAGILRYLYSPSPSHDTCGSHLLRCGGEKTILSAAS